MKQLRDQNEIFRVISGQIVRLSRQFGEDVSHSNDSSFSNRTRLKEFGIIRNASARLYEALCSACSMHTDHLVKFCLDATCHESITDSDGSQVCFNLAYAPIAVVGTTTIPWSGTPRTDEKSRDPPENRSIPQDLEVLFSAASNSDVHGEAKWFEVKSTMDLWKKDRVETDDLTMTEGMQSNEGDTISRGKHVHSDDLCIKLQVRTDAKGTGSQKALILVLNDTQSCRHCVYYPSDHAPPPESGATSRSLMQLLSTSRKHPAGNIPQLYRLRIARSLAMAVLQFHATPWLTESWQSKTLFFNNANANPENWETYDPSPHLVVQVAAAVENKQQLPTIATQTSLTPLTATFAPNLTLFNLGVMLLELAYGVPYQSLLQLACIDATLSEERRSAADYYSAAYHLASNAGVFFGSAYAAIIRKCLRCDFGEGEDLDKPALQQRLYEDVVCRLEEMENGIRKSQGHDEI